MTNRATHALEAVLAAALILGPAITIGIAFDTSSGTIAQWVAALATLGALGAAIYAGTQAAEIVRVERERDNRNEDARKRSQAELIAVWTDGRFKLTVVNLSSVPVYDLRIIFTIGDQAATRRFGILSPSDRVGRTREIRTFVGAYERASAALSEGQRMPRSHVSLTFTDAAGLRWERDFKGRLRELDHESS